MNDTLVAAVNDVLNAELPTEATALKSALGVAAKLRQPLLTARVTAQAELYRRKDQYRHPKDIKEFTDLDRSIMLEAAVSEFNATYEQLAGLESLLSERITILLAILR